MERGPGPVGVLMDPQTGLDTSCISCARGTALCICCFTRPCAAMRQKGELQVEIIQPGMYPGVKDAWRRAQWQRMWQGVTRGGGKDGRYGDGGVFGRGNADGLALLPTTLQWIMTSTSLHPYVVSTTRRALHPPSSTSSPGSYANSPFNKSLISNTLTTHSIQPHIAIFPRSPVHLRGHP
ncbi:hypothetical protein K439DRAFT_753098 [Ramaria rubella]|nr:hypothetical protein K439DRAFT_753098 [Ramaria rubella]